MPFSKQQHHSPVPLHQQNKFCKIRQRFWHAKVGVTQQNKFKSLLTVLLWWNTISWSCNKDWNGGSFIFREKEHILYLYILPWWLCHLAQIQPVHPILPLWSASCDNNDSLISPRVSPIHCHCLPKAETAACWKKTCLPIYKCYNKEIHSQRCLPPSKRRNAWDPQGFYKCRTLTVNFLFPHFFFKVNTLVYKAASISCNARFQEEDTHNAKDFSPEAFFSPWFPFYVH